MPLIHLWYLYYDAYDDAYDDTHRLLFAIESSFYEKRKKKEWQKIRACCCYQCQLAFHFFTTTTTALAFSLARLPSVWMSLVFLFFILFFELVKVPLAHQLSLFLSPFARTYDSISTLCQDRTTKITTSVLFFSFFLLMVLWPPFLGLHPP